MVKVNKILIVWEFLYDFIVLAGQITWSKIPSNKQNILFSWKEEIIPYYLTFLSYKEGESKYPKV